MIMNNSKIKAKYWLKTLAFSAMLSLGLGCSSEENSGINTPDNNNIQNSQFPCENGMAGIYPCNGYDLMAEIDVLSLSGSSAERGSDIWGWTDPQTNREYAILAMTNATAFVDVTNPTNPINLGRINTAQGNAAWRDVKVYNNHAFIVADGSANSNHGMQVFDLTRLRNVTNTRAVFTPDTT